MQVLTADHLREWLLYDPETGIFTWRKNAGVYGRIPAGTKAGHVSAAHGYEHINILGKLHKSHRLAWLYMNGEWPVDEIDHVNRARSDNRWVNLRQCTKAKNLQNKNTYKSNSSGCPGVTWHKLICKWQARIGTNGKRTHLGYWDALEDAAAAYLSAKAVAHSFAA